jgi:hypothetical protein
MSILCWNRINKNFDSVPPLPSAKKFYDNPDNQSTSIIDICFGNIEHGNGCKCCTSRKIVKQNEEMREQKWKEICKQRKLTKITEKEQEHKDRWDREQENFEKWRMKCGFY